jgi:hypothetical protein
MAVLTIVLTGAARRQAADPGTACHHDQTPVPYQTPPGLTHRPATVPLIGTAT